jgi:flavin reductase (DIM6/NTAB) family NADH-FMN oxidoreductase RutF
MSNKDDGYLNAITVSSVTSISMDPPSLLICINKSARIHDTLKIGSEFCINLLNKDQEELSNICSDEDSYDERFNDKNWNTKGVPFLANAQANIFCKVDKLSSYHTHTIVVGLVEEANYSNEISTLTYVDGNYK